MTQETAEWIGRIIPVLLFGVVLAFVWKKRRSPASLPPGKGWIRFFDKEGIEIQGARRRILTTMTLVVLALLLAAVVFALIPWSQ